MPTRERKSKKNSGRLFQAPRGMHDILPADQPYWERVESVVRDVARSYNFSRLEPPVLEFAELYVKTTGEDTDVVRKEMYTLKTKGGDVLALRPEYTPGIFRAYLENNLGRLAQPQKFFHLGPVFRHDRPQLGRYRQFSQFGFEVIGGPNDPLYDALVMLAFANILDELKLKNTVLKLNSIGCRICRPIYKKQLQAYYKNHEKELCADCLRRLKINPLRLLDCKEEHCEKLKAKAPNFLDKLCLNCSAHFKGVLEYLDELGLAYTLDNRMVRGLDYYSRTVFEFYATGPGAEVGALPAGGRYDYLSEALGVHLTPATGGACGVERLIAVMKAEDVKLPQRNHRRIFLAHAGDLAKRKALKLLRDLRAQGFYVSEALSRDSLKTQLKAADKEGIALALILGQKEIYEKSVILRDMRTGLQESVSLDKIGYEIKKREKNP